MPELQLGCHSVQTHGTIVMRIHWHDWLILVLLAMIDGALNTIEPFHRFVGEDMMTDLKYPLKGNTVPIWAVPIYAVLLPVLIFLVYYYFRKDVYDLHHATLGLLYSIGITAVVTDAIKVAVGQPRPDFFYRCFPDGLAVFNVATHDVACNGDQGVIKEGYKSFPSGHTSWSFAGMVFLSWYMSGKLKAFDRRGHVAKLCIVILPILIAALVGVSRVDDYWHHWQDVFIGAILGTVFLLSVTCSSSPSHTMSMASWAPHAYFQVMEERNRYSSTIPHSDVESPYARSEHGIEMTASSPTHSTLPVVDGMEAGRRR